MIEFSCPSCDAELEAPATRAGSKVKCPECGERFIIPAKGKRGSAARERESEERPRQASAGRGSRPSRRRDRDDDERAPRSGSNTGLILACAGGGAVLLIGMVIALVVAMRSGKEQARIENPQIVQGPPQFVNQQKQEPVDNPVRETKKEESANLSAPEILASDDGGQLIYKHLLKSAVWILSIQQQQLQGGVQQGTRVSGGTGTLVDRKNRLVLTNHHVVDGGQAIVVFFPSFNNGKLLAERDFFLEQVKQNDVIRGKVLAAEQRRDLALIQVDRVPDGIEALTLAKTSTSPGNPVHSIGNPGSSGALWIYTSGTVRQVYEKEWRTGPDTIHHAKVVETQSPTNHGDSGGPLVNSRGELVGVTHGGSSTAQLLSLFIDVSEAADFISTTCNSNGLTWERENRVIIAGNAAGVPGLIRNLEAADSRARGNAAMALGGAGVEARMAVGPLLKLLGGETDPLTRRLAVEALNKIGPPERAEVPVLIAALRDDHPEVRSYAASALGKLGRDARSALGDLLKAAKDKDSGVRQNVLRALGRFGLDGKDTILPILTDALKDSDRDVRLAGAEALTSLNGLSPADLPMLQELLKHEDVEVRAAAARVLAQMGRAAKPATAALVAASKAGGLVRKNAVEALASIGGPAKDVVPIFADVLTDTDKALCKTATVALGKYGADAKDAVPALGALLGDTDKELRKSAATALGKIGHDAKAAVPALAEALREDDHDFRLEVLDALGAIGPDAKGAVAAMIQVFESQKKDIHRNVPRHSAKSARTR
jgi:HEAT repeat protein/S1-C subfamily serine protease